jgi:hypothetical protein
MQVTLLHTTVAIVEETHILVMFTLLAAAAEAAGAIRRHGHMVKHKAEVILEVTEAAMEPVLLQVLVTPRLQEQV